MNRRWLLAFLGLVAASKVKAQTLIRRSQLYVPAVTNNMISILRPPGAELLADLGSSLKLTRYTNPARDELDVDWTKAPAQPQQIPGLRIAPRVLTLTDGNKFVNPEPIPNNHLLVLNGQIMLAGVDYTYNGNVIVGLHPGLLEPDSKVVIVY